MNEIEHSLRHIQDWRRYLDKNGATGLSYLHWCLNMGLWETLGFVDDAARPNVFGWLITGKNIFDI